MSNSDQNDTISLRDLLPGMLSLRSKLPGIISSGLSIAFLLDSLPLSLGKIFERNAVKFKNQPAIIFEDVSYTYGELNELVNRYANYFKSAGIKRGNVVIVMLENRPEALIVTAALAKLGAIASLINPQQRGAILLHSIRLKFGKHFLIGEELIDAFEEIHADLEHEATEIHAFGIEDKGQRKFPNHYILLKEAIENSSTENLRETRDIRTREHLSYIFTSGTTGMPKASIQTHKKWLRCMNWFGKINLALKPGDVMYAPLPFFHANVFLIAWPTVFTYGAALVMKRKFSVKDFWPDIRKYNATAFIYIGEVCRYLLNAPATPEDKDHKIQKVIGNGLRPDIWSAFKERFGIENIYEFYGASDSNIIFTNTLNIDCSVGWSPVDFTIVRYDVDEDEPVRNKKGRCIQVGKGETGLMLSKITTRFPFDGYVRKSSNESKIIRDVLKKGDEYFNTGDLMKNLGYKHLQFVDRVGDTFRWKGENVATAEVEQVINSMDFVDSCTVYGVQIPSCDGRAGMVSIIPNKQTAANQIETLANTLKDQLPAYAVPRFIRLTDEFEVTPTQKIKKNKLKEEGFDPNAIEDAVYVLLPGCDCYQPLDREVFSEIQDCRHSF